MSDFGDDIKEAIEEVGTAITLEKESQVISGEYIVTKLNKQVTKPFIREFFVEAEFAYDSLSTVGDIVQIDVTGEHFILMNKTPALFENDVYLHSAVLYKANVSGEILRSSGETWENPEVHKQSTYEVVASDCYALITEPLFGGGVEEDEELGEIGLARNELYIPERYGILEGDRYRAISGEYYKVNAIKLRRFPGVLVCELSEDYR